MPRLILLSCAVAVAIFLSSIALAQESRFCEAEQMELRGFSVGRNVAASYSGHGEFAISYVRLAKGQKSRRPKDLALAARFEKPLPPGEYQVILRFIDPCRIRVTLGDQRVEHELKATRYDGVTLTIAKPATRFELRVLECGIRVIFDWVFITSDPSHAIERPRGRFRLVKRETPTDLVAPDAPNHIANGSFEAGAPVGWNTPYQGGLALFSSMIDDAHKIHGKYSLKVPIVRVARSPDAYSASRMSYDPVVVEKGKSYCFFLHARSDRKARVGLSARLEGERRGWDMSLEVGSEWKKIQLDIGPVPRKARLTVGINLQSDGPGSVWLDAIGLGSAGEFTGRKMVEAGPMWKRPANIMILGRDKAELAAWSEPLRVVQNWRFDYRVYDVNDTLILSRSIPHADLPAESVRTPLDLPADTTGVYRMQYRTTIGKDEGEWRQVCYSVLPDTWKLDDTPIGLYGSFFQQALEIYELAGFRSTCSLSAGGHIGYWHLDEPVYGKGYVFFDEDVANARKHRVRIVCNLDTRPYAWPKGLPFSKEPPDEPWVRHRKKGYFPLKAWRGFVRAMADHYRGSIRDWLIIDEPASQYTAEEYAKLLKTSHEELKAADPANRVFMHGHMVANRTYLDELDKLGAPQYCDGLYDYVRSTANAERFLKWKQEHGKPLFTVEYGGFTTFYVRPWESLDNPFSLPARDNVDWSLISAVRSLCWPRAERYFRYDARFTGSHGYMTLFHPDGTLKPAGVALAVLNSKIAGMRPDGEAKLPKPVQGFAFASNERELLAVRHAGQGGVRLDLRLDPELIQVSDMMGRPLECPAERGLLQLVADKHFRYVSYRAENRDAVRSAVASARKRDPIQVRPSLARTRGRPLALRLRLTNRMPNPFSGFVCPDRASLFHVKGYTPVKQERRGLQQRLSTRVELAPGASTTVAFPLNYPRNKRFRADAGSSVFGLAVESAALAQILDVRLDRIK